MSRTESLYCPFSPEIHPDASSVHETSLRWAQALGMLSTEQHVRAAHQAKVGWLVARAFPTALPHGLQLIADWTLLFCSLDDHIEQLGTAGAIEAYLQHLLDVFRADIASSSEDPFVAGMLDLRRRLLAIAPPSHLTRFTERLAELFAANVAEAWNRDGAKIPDIASYVHLRAITVGLHVIFELSELLEGVRLSDRTREHPTLQQLATRTSNIVGWANDLFTYEKELRQGEVHNLVMVLMNERRLSMTEAVAAAVALHDNEVRGFQQDVEQLPYFGLADVGVQRYVAMLRCWIRGHLDWAHETGRYRPLDEPCATQAARPAEQLAAA